MKQEATVEFRSNGIVCKARRKDGSMSFLAIDYGNIDAVECYIARFSVNTFSARLHIMSKNDRDTNYSIDLRVFDSEEDMLKSNIYVKVDILMKDILEYQRGPERILKTIDFSRDSDE